MLLDPSTFLTNDPSTAKEFLSPQFRDRIGALEAGTIAKAGALLYHYPADEVSALSDSDGLAYLNYQLRRSQMLCTALWLVRDHSVNFELGFLSRSRGPIYVVTSNALAAFGTTAEGVLTSTVFSKSDLALARTYFSSLVARAAPEEAVVPVDTARPERAFFFLTAARASSTLGVRIAHYVTALEALFATEASELTHRLSERIALFLESDLEARLATYEVVRRAYGVRSRTVHGDRLSKSQFKEVQQISVAIDQVLRRVLCRLLTAPSLLDLFCSKSDVLENYLLRLTLGAPPAV